MEKANEWDTSKTCSADLDMYEIALLMWYCGMTGEEVRNEKDWTRYGCSLEILLYKAEVYADEKNVDVLEWERTAYGEEI